MKRWTKEQYWSIDMTLTKCPKCGYERFDLIAGSCERRQCGLELLMWPNCIDGKRGAWLAARHTFTRMSPYQSHWSYKHPCQMCRSQTLHTIAEHIFLANGEDIPKVKPRRR